MSAVTVIDLLRHGEPQGGRKFRGAVDDPLSALGWEQMRAAVGDVHPWQVVVTSPLTRCAAFAEELAQQNACSLRVEPQFREISFGIWEGRAVAEVEEQHPQALGQFWRDPVAYPIPHGEPLPDFDQRIASAWEALLQQHSGQHLLLVTHGGVIRVLLRQLLDMPLQRIWRIEVPFASLKRIRVHGDALAEPYLVFHNGCPT